MPTIFILGLIGGLLVLAFVANRIFNLTRIPDIILLMALGVVLGPATHLVNAQRFSSATNLLGTVAIILVLFEGGLELDLRETLRALSRQPAPRHSCLHFQHGHRDVHRMQGAGTVSNRGIAGGRCARLHQQHGRPSRLAADADRRIGADHADAGGFLGRRAGRPDGRAADFMKLRSHGGSIAKGVLSGVLNQVGVATLFSVIVGVLWSRMLRVLSEQRFWQVLTFSIVLVLYAGMEALGANGLIAVLMFGLTLANFPGIDPDVVGSLGLGLGSQSHQSLLTFHSELAFLMRTFFFRADRSDCRHWHVPPPFAAHRGDHWGNLCCALDLDSDEPLGVARHWTERAGRDFVDAAARPHHGCACPGSHRSGGQRPRVSSRTVVCSDPGNQSSCGFRKLAGKKAATKRRHFNHCRSRGRRPRIGRDTRNRQQPPLDS